MTYYPSFQLVASLPFFRITRVTRLIRLLRIVRLVGLTGRLRSFLKTNGLIYYLYISIVILLITSSIYSLSETTSLDNALWWSITTATTVGYGDISPHIAMGRFVAVLLMLLGIGLVGMLTSSITNFFTNQDEVNIHDEFLKLQRENQQLTEKMNEIENFSKKIQKAYNNKVIYFVKRSFLMMKINKIVACGLVCLIGGGAAVSTVTNQPIVVKAATNSQVNTKISKALKECQDWAAGRKDQNGKKITNGTANLAYQWSTYVSSIQYSGGKKLTINVNNNFDDLQDSAKRDTLNSAENCANQVLIEQKKISAEDANKGLTITVRDGHGVVGRSDKLSNRLYDFN